MIKIAICDDKKIEIENLYKEIDIIFSKYASSANKIKIYKYTEPHKLIEDYKTEKYDLIFLDIEMPIMDGFYVSEILTNISSDVKIVFVTSHDDLVYDSFKYTPVEFIRKSTLSSDIARKGNYIFSKIQKSRANYIFVQNNTHIDLKLSDIIYIENLRNDIKMYTTNDHIYELKRKTLQNFIEELNYSNIIQINKSFAVNIEYMSSPSKYDTITLIKNDIILPVGRKFKNKLNDKFKEYVKGFKI